MTAAQYENLVRLDAERAASAWIDQIQRIRRCERPTYRISSAGLELLDDGHSDREREMIRQCQSQIDAIWDRAVELIAAGPH